MLPGVWDMKTQAKVAKNLGFDPENPIVKSEVSRIIRRYFSDTHDSLTDNENSVPLLGYQELVVEFEGPEKEQQDSAGRDQEAVINKQVETTSRKPFYFLAALAVLIVTISFFIVSGANKRKNV